MKKVEKKFKFNKAENSKLIKHFDNILVKMRGFIFRLPPKNQHVICLASGGLDTTVVMGVLMSKYNLQVHPLYLERHLENSRKIWHSLLKISERLKRQFPKLYHSPIRISYRIPPEEINLPYVVRSPNERIFKSFFGNNTQFGHERIIDMDGHKQGIPLQQVHYAAVGMHYAQYLFETKGINCKTIIGGSLPSNTEWYIYESLTVNRAITLLLCLQYNDFSWQFTSYPMERELGNYFDKDEIVRLGKKYRLPMDKTWSCWLSGKYHCGECTSCKLRKNSFLKTGITDPTIYKKI